MNRELISKRTRIESRNLLAAEVWELVEGWPISGKPLSNRGGPRVERWPCPISNTSQREMETSS